MKSHLRAWLSAGLSICAVAFAGCDKIALPGGGGQTQSSPTSSAPGQSSGSGTVYNGITIDQLKAIFTTAGASVTEVQPGILRVADGPIVQLTQCPPEDNGLCYEIQISRTFKDVKPPVDAVNKWNTSTKIPEASIDDSGVLHLEFWVTTVGMTSQLLIDSVGWFEGAWQAPDSQEFWKPYMVQPTT